MRKYIVIYVMIAALSVGTIIYGWVFVGDQIGNAVLSEETISGERSAADGLVVSFRADSGDDLHWMNRYDFTSSKTKSTFRRGEMEKTVDAVVYDDMRFTGWSTVPFYTQLQYEELDGLQDKKINALYDRLQAQTLKDRKERKGSLKLADYLDYYPISFRFQFGEKVYNSNSMLSGLKSIEGKSKETMTEGLQAFSHDMALYRALNEKFRIPVIDNEYQEYSVAFAGEKNNKRDLRTQTKIRKPVGEGRDYYEFDPVIVLQQENIRDGKAWEHPDLDNAYSRDEESDEEDAAGKKATDYGLKNKLLFAPNNRTAGGKSVDTSEIEDGYGIYELPIDSNAAISIGKGRKNMMIPDPKPIIDELSFVYPLDEDAECVEMSMSADHRFLAVFSVIEEEYSVEIVDADMWETRFRSSIFPKSETLVYAWGEDGTLAASDLEGHIAVLTRTGEEEKPYELFYSGDADGVGRDLFSSKMVIKNNSYSRYDYGEDHGLAIAYDGDRVAMIQNSPVGDTESDLRNADLECAVIDRSGIAYMGHLRSSLVDIDYKMVSEDIKEIQEIAANTKSPDIIKPVGNENRCGWND